jgi:hypothetical protein
VAVKFGELVGIRQFEEIGKLGELKAWEKFGEFDAGEAEAMGACRAGDLEKLDEPKLS